MVKYRMRVQCLRCNKSYVTNLLHRKNKNHPKLPRRCKKCKSTRLIKINFWKIK